MRCIEMTAHDKPKDTQAAMDWLARVRGVEDYELFVHVDAGCHETLGVLRAHPLPHVRLLKQFKLGRNTNTYEALRHGFDECKAGFVISMSDDVLPGPDFIEFNEYCAKRYRDSKSVFSVSAYGHEMPVGTTDQNKLSFRSEFTTFGWATWKDRWKRIRDNWVPDDSTCWDRHIFNRVVGDGKEVFPVLSRSQYVHNVGEYWSGATGSVSGKWHE